MREIDDAMNAERQSEIDAAFAAYETYVSAKRKADRTLSFADCHDAAQAWVRFLNLYLGDSSQMAALPSPTATLIPFGGAA